MRLTALRGFQAFQTFQSFKTLKLKLTAETLSTPSSKKFEIRNPKFYFVPFAFFAVKCLLRLQLRRARSLW